MLYTYYGDDFTGSTDVLEQLASNGVPTVLFLAEPTPEHLAKFPEAKAVGIAGDSRSRSPEWMSHNLPRIFTTLRQFNAPINHYKVCSTFDSSPTHGSIGRAIEIGREVFNSNFIPIAVAAPHLSRFVRNGQLFAKAPDGEIKRIDQHPMANHPVTPMREPDLRKHLAAQTNLQIGHIDLATLASPNLEEELKRQLRSGNKAILFDGEDSASLTTIGKLIWSLAQHQPLFAAGSSGLTAALILSSRHSERSEESPHFADSSSISPERIDNPAPVLVISGSCSPVTAGQIAWALANGFHGIPIDANKLLNSSAERNRIADATTASLSAGRDTILYTALGQPDEAAHGDNLGQTLGHLLHELLHENKTRRVILCGGDTSSHAIQQLNLYALTWIRNTQPGAPLCLTHSEDPALHNRELILKGGQVGTPDFLCSAK